MQFLLLRNTRLKSALRARPRCARMESSSGLTSSNPMVRTHTLDPTPDAPRSYNPAAIRLLIKDLKKLRYLEYPIKFLDHVDSIFCSQNLMNELGPSFVIEKFWVAMLRDVALNWNRSICQSQPGKDFALWWKRVCQNNFNFAPTTCMWFSSWLSFTAA